MFPPVKYCTWLVLLFLQRPAAAAGSSFLLLHQITNTLSQMNTLYPLKFKPILKDKIWGGTRLRQTLGKATKSDQVGESWEISGYPGSISKVTNGFLSGNSLDELIEVYMGDLVGDTIFERFGTLFPLLFKFIDANDYLSVQVHPNDELALVQFRSYGKTEMWYVLEAEPGAEIIAGFNQPVTPAEYASHVQADSILQILNKTLASSGDVYFLPAGRIHAIGAGLLLAEIQQTSDATLRIYDYNRLDDSGKARELHTEMAIEAIDFSQPGEARVTYTHKQNKPVQLVTCAYFTTNKLVIDRDLERDHSSIDSFVVYMCLDGSVDLRYRKDQTERISRGETVLVPAELKEITLVPHGQSTLLEVYIPSTSKDTSELIERLF